MKRTMVSLALTLCLVLAACTSAEQNARNSAAALKGAIESAQSLYLTTCQANPSQPVCGAISRSVAGQNALITSIEAYCGWSQAAPPPDLNATCVPVKTATGALQSAIANANLLITELRSIITTTPAKGVTP